MLARFDIVLVAFPFTDGPNVKPRPAELAAQVLFEQQAAAPAVLVDPELAAGLPRALPFGNWVSMKVFAAQI